MIETSELRIGNYLLYNNQPVIVKGITANIVMLDDVKCDTGNSPVGYKQISAVDNNLCSIPLCDTILQGIRSRVPQKIGYAYSYYGSKATFLIYPENGEFFIGMDYRGYVIHVTPNHVNTLHQLQNIYFAQYGAEMDINEKHLSRAVALAISYGEI